MNSLLLDIKNLNVTFNSYQGTVYAVNGVSFSINQNETIGIVGESGCGKSVTALSIMKLLPATGTKLSADFIKYKIQDLMRLSNKAMNAIRGKEIAMIFQEPMSSLNPVYTVGDQISESLILHERITKKEALKKSINLLEQVYIPHASARIKCYPHELSGGIRQRVMIAIALSCNPSLLIADEPTTSLDVTIQAQILKLIKEIQSRHRMTIIFISHNLGVIAEIADRIIVMYSGVIVEEANTRDLFNLPLHPYTKGLLASIPSLNNEKKLLNIIPGNIPDSHTLTSGCKFYPRCTCSFSRCKTSTPDLILVGERKVRCWKYME